MNRFVQASALTLCALLSPLYSLAYDGTEVVDGNTIYYNINPDNTIEITNKGNTNSASYSGDVKIPETIDGKTVIGIGKLAFCNCRDLSSIELPNTITYIKEGAFRGCHALSSFEIPTGMTSISDEAFSYCSSLASLEIPANIKSIGKEAFILCTSLTTLAIPATVESVGESAFSDCGIKELTIPGPTKLEWNAFKSCPLEILCINEDCDTRTIIGTSVYDDVFAQNNLCEYEYEVTPTTAKLKCKRLGLYIISAQTGEEALYNKVRINDREFAWNVGDEVIVDNLWPDNDYSLNATKTVQYNYFRTQALDQSIDIIGDVCANGATVKLTHNTDAGLVIDSSTINIDGQTIDAITNKPIVLNWPATSAKHEITATWTIKVGTTEYKPAYKVTKKLEVPAVNWTNVEAIPTSLSSVRLKSNVNLITGVDNTGIEWRRDDAPESVKSTDAACPVVNQTLVGELRGIRSDVYYKFRPYCTLGDYTRSYGEWVGFYTGDVMVTFDPEVVTMDATVNSTSATFEGMALAGSDPIESQGFEYRVVGPANSTNRAPGQWVSIEASGILMHAEVDNLEYEREYEFRSFAKAGGKTYYGDAITFRTPASAGIETIEMANGKDYTVKVAQNPCVNAPEIFINGNTEDNEVYIISLTGTTVYSGKAVSGEWVKLPVNLANGHYILYVTDGKKKDALHLLVK